MGRPIIEVRNVSKCYRIGVRGGGQYHTLRDQVAGLFQRKKAEPPQPGDASSEFWALRDVSLEVQPGEVLGVIGSNGAGKSTLLKIMSRVTEPTQGEIVLRGRVASLLEVGTGFHPELTGRENIYLNGVVLGMKRAEVARKFDEIVAFSGVERFLDTPVKRYSSGMYVRLAFAVAAHLDPEVLIVDEVLAVGDVEFQKKCLGKMRDVARQEGKTVLFVSHNLFAVRRLCRQAVLLREGRIQAQGDTKTICELYQSHVLRQRSRVEWDDPADAPGSEVCRLVRLRMCGEDGEDIGAADVAEPFAVEMTFRVLKEGHVLTPNFHFHTADGQCLFAAHDWDEEWRARPRPAGTYVCTLNVPANLLADGMISIGCGVTTFDPFRMHFFEKNLIQIAMQDSGRADSARGDHLGYYPGIFRPLLRTTTRCHPDGTLP